MDILKTETRTIALKDLHNNTGQIEGVPANPRVLRDEHYKRLLQSLKDSNLTGVLPLKVIDHNGEWVVLGGNMRLRALQELKAKEVACIVVPSDTDVETLRKVVITDNSNFGEWDNDMLANEWDADELKDWGVELPEFGKEEEQPTAQEDDFDEHKDDIPAKVQKGEVWQLGDHRLMCGDSTSADDVEKLMDGQKAVLCITDPPYGVSIGDRNKVLNEKNGTHSIDTNIMNDTLPADQLQELLTEAMTNCRLNSEDYASYYVFSPQGGGSGDDDDDDDGECQPQDAPHACVGEERRRLFNGSARLRLQA